MVLVPEADVEVLLLLLGFVYTGGVQLDLLDLLMPPTVVGLPSVCLPSEGALPPTQRSCHRSCSAARACLRAVLCADALLLPGFRRACRYSRAEWGAG